MVTYWLVSERKEKLKNEKKMKNERRSVDPLDNDPLAAYPTRNWPDSTLTARVDRWYWTNHL